MTIRVIGSWLLILFLALAITGCGGGGEAPAESADDSGGEGDALVAGDPDPPPQETIGIGGGGANSGPNVSVGGNSLSGSDTVGEWQLPPTMFGAIADFEWQASGGNPNALTTVTITAGSDSNLTWTISKSGTNVSYAVNDNGTARTVTAYTPSNKNCSLMGTGMAKFTSTGTSFTGNHTFNGTVSIGYKTTPASDTGCH